MSAEHDPEGRRVSLVYLFYAFSGVTLAKTLSDGLSLEAILRITLAEEQVAVIRRGELTATFGVGVGNCW